MAEILIDGCDHYNTTVLQSATTAWNIISGSPTVLPTSGRFGGPCISCNNSGGGVRSILDTNLQDFIEGAWLKNPASSSAGINLFNTADSSSNARVRLYTNSANAVYVTNGNGTVIGTSSNNVFPLQAWNWVVWKVHISTSAGTVEVWINGTRVLNLTSVDTQSGGLAGTTIASIGFGENTGSMYVDDPFIFDTTGTVCNSIPAPQRSVTTQPNAAGGFAQWSLTGAASNQAAVNEATPDDDTSYNATNTVSNRDSFGHGTISGITSITGAMLMARARVDDASAHTINLTTSHSGSDMIGAAKTLTGSYLNYRQPASIDPATSALWASLAAINAAEIGYELAS